MRADHLKVAERATRTLRLAETELGDEYYYNSLSLCVIDAVFSIGVRYESVQAVVRRYCEHFALDRFRSDRVALPTPDQQDSLSDLLGRFDTLGLERMTTDVFANRQRTSTQSGITKAEAVMRFAAVLRDHGIERLQDVASRLPTDALERDIASIPGQRSGISLQYFWMLAGSDDLIKPDRMILRFLDETLSRRVPTDEAQEILRGAVGLLKAEHPKLTPRRLDFAIWQYQRDSTSAQ